MKLKQKSYLIGLAFLCIAVYQSDAKPLLQCVVGVENIGQNNDGIKAYVVEQDKRGVYGRWYNIHDYDSTPKVGTWELLNKNGDFAGNVTSMVILKDVNSHSQLPIQKRMNLRFIHSIQGTVFNSNNNTYSKFNLEQFGLERYASNSVKFYSWIFNGLDEKGEQKNNMTLYCSNPTYMEKADLYNYLNDSFIKVTEIPYILLESFEKKINNIATFRLSYKPSLLSSTEISTLKTIEWRIMGKTNNTYTIDYRLSPYDQWSNTHAEIITIDPDYPENTHYLDDPFQQYYTFGFTYSDPDKKDVKYSVSIIADIIKSKNKISYIKFVNEKKVDASITVIDDNYIVTHKAPLSIQLQEQIKKQEQLPVIVEELEEKANK